MRAVVFLLRGLHAGYLGGYGNAWVQTPALDRLAADGIVFDQHYADGTDSWRTGRYALPAAPDELPVSSAEQPDLFRLLRAHDVETEVLVNDDWPAATDWIASHAERDRGLLWLDLPALLPPWPEPEDDEPEAAEEPEEVRALLRVQTAYAEVVRAVDAGLGALLDDLTEQGQLDDLLLVITSDRGVALGEHGVIGADHAWLHDELIHLPLIVRLPGGAEAGRRVFALTQPVDLLPTLLEFFGVPVPTATHGRSLWPLIRGAVSEVRPYACSGMQTGDSAEWALRTPEWAFLLPLRVPEGGPRRERQLYVKPDDRWEVNNVLQHHLELADHFEQTLRDFVRASHEPGPLRAPVLRRTETEQSEPIPIEGNP
jgi:arylsulfatase A-like enzyme